MSGTRSVILIGSHNQFPMEINQPVREADRWLPSNNEVEADWSYFCMSHPSHHLCFDHSNNILSDTSPLRSDK